MKSDLILMADLQNYPLLYNDPNRHRSPANKCGYLLVESFTTISSGDFIAYAANAPMTSGMANKIHCGRPLQADQNTAQIRTNNRTRAARSNRPAYFRT